MCDPFNSSDKLPLLFWPVYQATWRAGLLCEFVLTASEVYNSQEVQYDENDGDHDQRVNPTSGAWETRAYVPAEKAEQPQD